MPPVLSKLATKEKEKMKLMQKFVDAFKMAEDAQYTLDQKRLLIRLSRTVMMYNKGHDIIGEVLRKVPVEINTDLSELKREYEKLVNECVEEDIDLDDAHIFQKVEEIKDAVWQRRFTAEVKMYTDHLALIEEHHLPLAATTSAIPTSTNK